VAIEIASFKREHLDGVIRLFAADNWSTYVSDPERTYRAFTATGAISLVAIDGGEPVGVVQLQSDGAIQAHVSTIAVAESHRRRGIGHSLLREALARSGALQIDTISGFDQFYEGLAGRRFSGFRITRADLGLDGRTGA
jgi:ribosomal protein S18 acetylase RimI-like enzyme